MTTANGADVLDQVDEWLADECRANAPDEEIAAAASAAQAELEPLERSVRELEVDAADAARRFRSEPTDVTHAQREVLAQRLANAREAHAEAHERLAPVVREHTRRKAIARLAELTAAPIPQRFEAIADAVETAIEKFEGVLREQSEQLAQAVQELNATTAEMRSIESLLGGNPATEPRQTMVHGFERLCGILQERIGTLNSWSLQNSQPRGVYVSYGTLSTGPALTVRLVTPVAPPAKLR